MSKLKKKSCHRNAHQGPLEALIECDLQKARIRTITALAKSARDDALRIGLKFEAYLLDTAVISLREQLEKQAK